MSQTKANIGLLLTLVGVTMTGTVAVLRPEIESLRIDNTRLMQEVVTQEKEIKLLKEQKLEIRQQAKRDRRQMLAKELLCKR